MEITVLSAWEREEERLSTDVGLKYWETGVIMGERNRDQSKIKYVGPEVEPSEAINTLEVRPQQSQS